MDEWAWVLKDTHVTIAQLLYNTLIELKQSEWPEADVKEELTGEKKFNSAWIQHAFPSRSTSKNPFENLTPIPKPRMKKEHLRGNTPTIVLPESLP